jgi:hypothetical protein
MKLQSTTVKILLSELDAVEKAINELRKSAREWTNIQEDRQVGYNPHPDDAYYARRNLETHLLDLRQHLATVYDFMGDKGMVYRENGKG